MNAPPETIRLGLCCLFQEDPVRFRTTTARYLSKLGHEAACAHRDRLVTENFLSLATAIDRCHEMGIGAFRITSQIIPLATHGDWLFDLGRLRSGPLADLAEQCKARAAQHNIRLSMHPDQFVVLSAHREEVVTASLAELEYQGAVCQSIGADVMNIHGGGGYGDKPAAMARFAANADRLSDTARSCLTVENDDRTYSPAELLELSSTTGIPLVYDVHHHRCNPDEMSITEATHAAISTWNREPLMHISSPINGWDGKTPNRHHDFIAPEDFPDSWLSLNHPITIDVEAKAKELAVLRLKSTLVGRLLPPPSYVNS